MIKEKELGYKLSDVIWHNLEGYQEIWNKADFDTKEKIINELGRLAIELIIPKLTISEYEWESKIEYTYEIRGYNIYFSKVGFKTYEEAKKEGKYKLNEYISLLN